MNANEAPELLGLIEAEFASSRNSVELSPELEAHYQADNDAVQSRHFFLAGLVAVILSDAFLVCDYLARPEIFFDIFLVRMLLVTVPCLAISFAVRYGVPPALRERLAILGIVLVSIATALINRWTMNSYASYDLFTISLIILTANIVLPMRFRTAFIASLLSLIVSELFVMGHPAIRLDAKMLSLFILLDTSIFTLFARFQLEKMQRLSYLNLLRERLRSQMVMEANQELEQISNTDTLTQLANRRQFLSAFGRHMAETDAKQGRSMAVLMIDIDHFKPYNDTFGHVEGDRCLAQVASIIRQNLHGEDDLAARLGGEEFAVLLPDASSGSACETAERIRYAVEDAQIPHDGVDGRRFVTISIGVTLTSTTLHETVEEVLARADEALYKAKNAGRNRMEAPPIRGVA